LKQKIFIFKTIAFSAKASQLLHLFSMQLEDNAAKIESVKEIFNNSHQKRLKRQYRYTFKAFETLEKMNIDDAKEVLLACFW
jgi:geranylgeranyl diphosphate synthase type II